MASTNLAHIYDEQAFETIWNDLPSNLETIRKCLREFDI